jgi:hypothetical protein
MPSPAPLNRSQVINSDFRAEAPESKQRALVPKAPEPSAAAADVTYDVPVAVAVDPMEPVPAVPVKGPGSEKEKEKEKALLQSAAASGSDKDKGVADQAGMIFSSLLDAISNFSSAVTAATTVKGDAVSPQAAGPLPRHGTTRDMFPRMPWHDIHAFVGGVVARDISSHFVQV